VWQKDKSKKEATSLWTLVQLKQLKEVIYIYPQITSIQNKVIVYYFGDRFNIFLQNKLGRHKVLKTFINK